MRHARFRGCARIRGAVLAAVREDAGVTRLVVLGNGASGKSTFARTVAATTGIALVELDTVFWSSDLEPLAPDRWVEVQAHLVIGDEWILDGDLGPYDVLAARLGRADTIVVFDLPTWRCAWRAGRRSRERLDFWRWLLSWRRRYRPHIMKTIEDRAPAADLFVIHDRRDLERLTTELLREARHKSAPRLSQFDAPRSFHL